MLNNNVCYLSESCVFRLWLAFKYFAHSSSGLSASGDHVTSEGEALRPEEECAKHLKASH